MSTTEETSTIAKTSIDEMVEETIQVTEYSSNVVTEENPVKDIDENGPNNSASSKLTEFSIHVDTEKQTESVKVDLIKEANYSSEESSETAKQLSVEGQESAPTEKIEKSELIESKEEIRSVEVSENVVLVDGVEDDQDKNQEPENTQVNPDESGATEVKPVNGESKDMMAEEATNNQDKNTSKQESEDTEVNPASIEQEDSELPNSESKERADEEATDEKVSKVEQVQDTPMDIDQTGDKSPTTESKSQPVETSDDEPPEEGVYIVEAVVAHRKRTGKIQYFLKWKGYPDTDNTWEDEDNLFCTELIEEYWKTKKHDTPVKTPVKKNKPLKRKPEEAEEIPKKKLKETHENNDREDSWENEVKEVETVEQTKDQLMIYLLWKNGRRSVHPSDEANKKCPQKIIQFYESHLSFKAS